MANVTPSTHRALLLHDSRFSAAGLALSGVSGADYTQADPVIGPVVPTLPTTPALVMAGSPTTDAGYELRCVRGGLPGASVGLIGDSDAIRAGPGVVWRRAGDTLYRGWEPPTAISEFEFLDRTTTANEWLDPHVVTGDDGTLYLVVQHSERYVATWSRQLGGEWAQTGVVYDAGSAVYASPVAACPCLVVLPRGRLLCLYWSSLTMSSSTSTDGGVTWSEPVIVDAVLGTAGIDPYRIRAAYANGQILMLVGTATGATSSVVQFASMDDGSSFAMVSLVVDNDAGYADVVAAPGGSGFVVATLETARDTTGSTVPPYVRRVASAYEFVMATSPTLAQLDADTARWGTRSGGSGSALTVGELALSVAPDGSLWLHGLNFAGTREGVSSRSTDGGVTWSLQDSTWYDCADATRGPRQFAVTWQGGRVVMPHTLNASTATASLACAYLGGHTTVCRPQVSSLYATPEGCTEWSVAWLPYALPEATGATWAYVPGGAPTVTLTVAGLRVQHGGVLDSTTWTATPSSTNASGLTVLCDLRSTVGAVYVQARIGSAVPSSYEVRVTVSPTQIVVRDVTAAADLVTLATTAGTTGVQILIGIADTAGGAVSGDAQVWYRPWGSDADREFALLHQATTLAQGASTTDRIQVGTGAGNAATDVYGRIIQYQEGIDTGAGLSVATSTATDRLLGSQVSPYLVPLAETGASLAGRVGPLTTGDEWTAAVGHGYGAERIDPAGAASPAVRWQSLADGVAQRLVWPLDEAAPMASPLAGVYLDGANFPLAYWEGWDGAAWVTLATIDLRRGTSLKYTRAGPVVYCGTGGGSAITDYLDRGELAGGTILLTAGQYRRIAGNTGGRWTGAAVTTTRPILTIEPVVGDSTSGSAAEIWSPRAAVVYRGATTAYSRYSLRIPASTTVEGYYTLGVLLAGPLVVLGAPDTERQLSRSVNVETTRARNGTRTRRRLGRASRAVQISWTDGVDGSNVHDAAPDYVTDYAGGTPVSTPAGLSGDIHGLIAECDVVPVVYLPVVAVPGGAGTVTTITSADLLLYADVVTDTIQSDVVVGDEHQGAGVGEYVRVGTVRLEEVI